MENQNLIQEILKQPLTVALIYFVLIFVGATIATKKFSWGFTIGMIFIAFYLPLLHIAVALMKIASYWAP